MGAGWIAQRGRLGLTHVLRAPASIDPSEKFADGPSKGTTIAAADIRRSAMTQGGLGTPKSARAIRCAPTPISLTQPRRMCAH